MSAIQAPQEVGHPWEELPEELQPLASRRWDAYWNEAQATDTRVVSDPAFRKNQCLLFSISEFIADTCIRHPALIEDLLDSGDLLADSWPEILGNRVSAKLASCSDVSELSKVARQIRRREMLRIAWRDLSAWSTLEETLRDLSDLADACVQGTLKKLEHWQASDTPPPKTAQGRLAHLVVIAMGKLGAHELNFSSDIDLIFAYPDARKARGKRALEPEQYFTHLGQSLIRVLDDVTEDGFVFRVDMRLRPYGDAGSLVCSFAALEDYYQFQGREWERYAMIKARPITGEVADRRAFMKMLRPFVYRRYLDFDAFDALRDLKRQIEREIQRKGEQDNLKLGPGGIREIEFVAQAFQLVRGGQEKALRRRGVVEILCTLASMELITQRSCDELLAAYAFLRRAENRLQEMDDKQNHHLPDSDPAQTQLSLAMGYENWKKLGLALYKHRNWVEQHFNQVFASPQTDENPKTNPLVEVWLDEVGASEAREVLSDAGFSEAGEAQRWLEALRTGSAPKYLGKQGRERFDRLVPMLLTAVASYPDAASLLGRVVNILEQIAGRTTYLALLEENPQALSQLVKLCAASSWIAQQIARFPILLDELLDPRMLYRRIERAEVQNELDRRLQGVSLTDLELQMDRLRQFKHGRVLRTAAADIAGAITVAAVGEELTTTAELVLEKVLQQSWVDMVRRYGQPLCTIDGKRRLVVFVIVAYGKMGGAELGYGSDLDLVFLHDSSGEDQETDGKKAVENSVFFARLGQRIIHALDTYTAAGLLYEVDMRLRPSGNSGLLVSSLEAFAQYQKEEAWIWEHQALVRARVVGGDQGLEKQFNKIRNGALTRSRDIEQLRTEVVEMRERMRAELGSGKRLGFNLKQDRGGIVDIEFMVQYLVLRWSNDYAQLLRCTGTIDLLQALRDAGVLRDKIADALIGIYQQYRAFANQLMLAEASTLLDDKQFISERKQVADIWKQMMKT